MLWSECEWLIVTNVEGSSDSTTLMLTGPGNLWISPRRPGPGAYMKFYDDDSAMHQLQHAPTASDIYDIILYISLLN